MSDAVAEIIVLRPGEGRHIDLGGFQMSVKATGNETGGVFSLSPKPMSHLASGRLSISTMTLQKLSMSLRASTSSSCRVARYPAALGHSSLSLLEYPTDSGSAKWLVENSTSTRQRPWLAISMN